MAVKLVTQGGDELTLNQSFRVRGLPVEREVPSLTVEGQDGEHVHEKQIRVRPRTLVATGYIYGDTADEAQANLDELNTILGQLSTFKLYKTDDDTRYINVRFQNLSHDFEEGTARKAARVSITFIAHDPYWYGAEQTVEAYLTGPSLRVEAENANRPGGFPQYVKVEFHGSGWSPVNHGLASGGKVIESGVVGDYVDVAFQGVGVTVIGYLGGFRIFNVYIDGVPDEGNPHAVFGSTFAPLYTKLGLTPGEHTIRVEVDKTAAQPVVLDAFDIIGSDQVTIDNPGNAPVYPTVFVEAQEREHSGNFMGKVRLSATENPHTSYAANSATDLEPDSASWLEVDQTGYNQIGIEDGVTGSNSTQVEDELPQSRFTFPLTDIAGGVVQKIKDFAKSIRLRWVGESRGVNNGVRNWQTVLKIWNAVQSLWESFMLIGPSFARSSVAYLEDGTEVAANVPRFERGNWSGYFDGTDDYIQVPDNDALDMGADSFAIEFRLKADGGGNAGVAGILHKLVHTGEGSERHQGYAVRLGSGGRINLRLFNNNSRQDIDSTISNLNDGQWHDVTAIVNRREMKVTFIIDGESEDVDLVQTGTLSSPASLYIGQNLVGPSVFYKGWLDEIRIWRREYSKAEALANRGTKLTGDEPGLVAYYSADEGDEGDGLAKDTAKPINLLTENQANGTEDGTTDGFNGVNSATIESSTAEAWQGSRSIKVVTPGSVVQEGARVDTTTALSGFQYTGTVYLKGEVGGEEVSLVIANQAGTTRGSKDIILTTDWQRFDITGTLLANETGVRLYVLTRGSAASVTFYMDGLQLQKGDTATPWVPVKTTPYNGTIVGATYSPDNAFGMPFGHSMLIEEGSTNSLSENHSSFEVGTSNISAVGTASFTRTNLWAWHGDYSLMVTGADSESNYVSLFLIPVQSGRTDTISLYAYNPNDTDITVYLGLAGLGYEGEGKKTIGPGQVSRVIATRTLGVTSSNSTIRFREETGKTFFVDMVQKEDGKGYPTSWTLGGTTRNNETLKIHTAGVFDTSQGTAEAWVYAPLNNSGGLNRACLLSDWHGTSSSANRSFDLRVTDGGRLSFAATGVSDIQTDAGKIPSNVWTYVAIAWDHGTYKLYVNGVLEATGTGAASLNPFSPTIAVGSFDFGWADSYRHYLNGFIGGLRISNRARTDEEIAVQYDRPFERDASTTLLLPFNKDLSGIYAYESVLTSPANYIDGDGAVHILARPRYASDGVDDAAILTDYVDFSVVHDMVKNPSLVNLGKNMVANGGFEELENGVPAGWSVFEGSPSLERIDPHGGNVAVKVFGSNNYYQDVSVRPGAFYALSHWIKGSVSETQATLNVQWRTASGSVIQTKTTSVAISTGWQRVQATYQAPSNAAVARVVAFKNGAEPAYIDDVQFEEVDASTDTATGYEEQRTQTATYTGELVTGDVLRLEGARRTVEQNGENALASVNSSFVVHGFKLNPGKNVLSLDSDIGAYKATLRYTPRWL